MSGKSTQQKLPVTTKRSQTPTTPLRKPATSSTVTPSPRAKSSIKSRKPSPISHIKIDAEDIDDNENNDNPTKSSSKFEDLPKKEIIKMKSIKEKCSSSNTVTAKFGSQTSKPSLSISPRIKKIYKLILKSTGTLGGNGYDGAIYGELTMHSMQRVINVLVEKCELTYASKFIDVGAGLGKPNFHVAQDPAVRISIGVELEDIRWKLSIHNLTVVLAQTSDPYEAAKAVDESTKEAIEDEILLHGGNTNFIVNDIDNAASTDPFTHIYQFDLGFPPVLQQSIARKFNCSKYARYLVSYRPPHRVIEEYGYSVEQVDQILTSMCGSGEGHTAYFYKRVNIPKVSSVSTLPIVRLPKRSGFEETDEDVHCDPVFIDAIATAVDELKATQAKIGKLFEYHLNSSRPVRNRKPTKR